MIDYAKNLREYDLCSFDEFNDLPHAYQGLRIRGREMVTFYWHGATILNYDTNQIDYYKRVVTEEELALWEALNSKDY